MGSGFAVAFIYILVFLIAGEITAQKDRFFMTMTKGHITELIAHPILGDHLANRLRCPLEIVPSARTDLA